MTTGENDGEDEIEATLLKNSNTLINPKAFSISIDLAGKKEGKMVERVKISLKIWKSTCMSSYRILMLLDMLTPIYIENKEIIDKRQVNQTIKLPLIVFLIFNTKRALFPSMLDNFSLYYVRVRRMFFNYFSPELGFVISYFSTAYYYLTSRSSALLSTSVLWQELVTF